MNRTSDAKRTASTCPADAPSPTATNASAATGVRHARHKSAAPITPTANQRSRHMGHLHFLRGERAVRERQTVATTAALDDVSRLRVFWKRQQFFAVRTAHLIGEGRDPAASVLPHPKGEACAVGALHQVSGPGAGR